MVQTSFKKLVTLEKGGEEKLMDVEGDGQVKPRGDLENLGKGGQEFIIVEEVKLEPRRATGFSYWLHEKLWTFIVLTCPFPYYVLIVGLAQHSSCVQQYEPIPFFFLVGLFGSLELINFTLFSPPKTYSHNHEQFDVVNFDHPEDIKYPEAGSNKPYHLVHFMLSVTSLWVWTGMYLEVFGGNVQAEYLGVFRWSNIVAAAATTVLFCLHYSRGLWMRRYNTKTLLTSIGFLAVTTFFFLLRFTCDCSSNFYQLIASIGLFATFFHLRFAYSFQHPPRWICMLTIRHLRNFLAEWYVWLVLCICALWGSLFVLVIGSTNNGSCSSMFFFSLYGSSIAVVIGLSVKLVYCCWSRKANSEEK
ncbi:unnamed protein product [Caenorhabditis brenneri]